MKVAVLIQPDGTLAIVPAVGMTLPEPNNDLDARLDKFGGL